MWFSFSSRSVCIDHAPPHIKTNRRRTNHRRKKVGKKAKTSFITPFKIIAPTQSPYLLTYFDLPHLLRPSLFSFSFTFTTHHPSKQKVDIFFSLSLVLVLESSQIPRKAGIITSSHISIGS